MLSNKPTIYVCNDPTTKDESDKIIEYINEKIKNRMVVNLSQRGDFSVVVPMLAEVLSEYDNNLGVVISDYCIYSSMILNRNKDIRSYICTNKEATEIAIRYYNINIMCIPLLLTTEQIRKEIIDVFFDMKKEERYTTRNYLLERL